MSGRTILLPLLLPRTAQLSPEKARLEPCLCPQQQLGSKGNKLTITKSKFPTHEE